MNQQPTTVECGVGTQPSQIRTPRDEIKQEAEECLLCAHDLDSGLDVDEGMRCATVDVLDSCIWSLDHAIDEYGLFYLRETEREWLREHAALPRGGFGQMLTYEDCYGVHQPRESGIQWKHASAIETMPPAIRENLTHLGMAIHNGHATLDHLYWLIDALIEGDDDTDSRE